MLREHSSCRPWAARSSGSLSNIDNSCSTTALQLQGYIAGNIARLQYRFTIEACVMGRPQLKSCSEGGFSGFKIDGVVHSIHGGIGECVLTRYEPFADDSGTMQQRIDVSDRKRLETDDWGDIRIKRRKAKYTLPDTLPEVIAFLDRIRTQTGHAADL